MSASERLLESRVLLVGAGTLGVFAAVQIAGAGVGALRVSDAKMAERSELGGQSLFSVLGSVD